MIYKIRLDKSSTASECIRQNIRQRSAGELKLLRLWLFILVFCMLKNSHCWRLCGEVLRPRWSPESSRSRWSGISCHWLRGTVALHCVAFVKVILMACMKRLWQEPRPLQCRNISLRCRCCWESWPSSYVLHINNDLQIICKSCIHNIL